MFQNWGFLITEIVILLAIAALLGLFIGWLIWGRASNVSVDTSEADGLRAALAECKSRGDEARLRAARVEAELADVKARAATASVAAEAKAAAPAPAALMSAPAPAAEPAPAAPAPEARAPSAPASGKGTKPKGLTEARGGKADDLKLIKGVGPALEKLCHKLGYFHFDQIAAWTATEIEWVDDNLEGFKGRVTRDEWVAQARDLAKGMAPR